MPSSFHQILFQSQKNTLRKPDFLPFEENCVQLLFVLINFIIFNNFPTSSSRKVDRDLSIYIYKY